MNNKKYDIISLAIEVVAFILIILTFIGTPVVIWWYEKAYLPGRHGPDTRIINLTATASGCIWTEESINGYNYWWKKFRPAEEIPVGLDEKVVIRVRSADVLHSFAIPRLRIGPFEIDAGKVQEIEFKPTRTGRLKYLCWLWCSECHPDLKGYLVVEE